MAERGGQPGNQNAIKNRPWRMAIERVLEKRSRKDQVDALDTLAEKFIEVVEAGDVSAIREFGDRLDGKPAQIIQGPGEAGEHTVVTRIEEIVVDPND